MKKTLGVSMLAVALMLTGCTGGPEAEGPTAATEIAFPDSEPGKNSQWVLEQLNSGEAMDPAKWGEKLAPKILEEVSADELLSALDDGLKAGAPYTLVGFSEDDGRAALNLVGANDEPRTLIVNFEDDGKVSGVFYH